MSSLSSPDATSTPSTLICYLFSESTERQEKKKVLDNLRYFLRHGLVDDPRYSFLFVSSTKGSGGGLPSGIALPEWAQRSPRVSIQALGSNIGYEFGNYRAALGKRCPANEPRCDFVLRPAFRHFGRFVLLADTVRGPFVPSYLSQSRWPDHFSALLSEEVKLVGTSINCNNCHRSVASCRYALHADGVSACKCCAEPHAPRRRAGPRSPAAVPRARIAPPHLSLTCSSALLAVPVAQATLSPPTARACGW